MAEFRRVLAPAFVLVVHPVGFQLAYDSMTVLCQKHLECADLYRDVQVPARVLVQVLMIAVVVVFLRALAQEVLVQALAVVVSLVFL